MRTGLLLFCIITITVVCDEDDHHYNLGDKLYAWTNRIGPYHNPHETYDYFSLPFCKPMIPDILASKKGGISEILEGTSLQNSGIVFSFRQDIMRTNICTMELNTEQVYKMQMAISNHYWYQMEVDGLPIWAKVGDLDLSEEKLNEIESHGSHHDVMPDHCLLYTHRHFSFGFNGDRIVEVNMTSSDPQKVEVGKPLVVSVSSSWSTSPVSFNKRFDRFIEYNFFESQIHWFSIFNSFMIVVFLAGLVALIMMRTLSMDYMRYAQEFTTETGNGRDDSGWKRVHGDVFRACEHLELYSILMGNGAHVAFTIVLSLLAIVLTSTYLGHDSVLAIIISVYLAGFIVNGFVSGSIFKQAYFPRTSPGWQQTMLLSALLVPGVLLAVYSALCVVAIAHGSLAAFPVHNVVVLVVAVFLLCIPLHTVGTIIGRSLQGNPNNPCRVASLPSPIPPAAVYAQPKFICWISGILPFGSIFIEIFFIFASIWSYKYYYVYGFLASMIQILVIIQVCVSIVGTYVLLNAENYNWRWTSFLSGASIGIYLLMYCVYFYFFKTEMSGFIQASYFFAESILLVSGVAIFCGYVSSTASEVFVKRIFKNIKVD